jgi:hypothetical protein
MNKTVAVIGVLLALSGCEARVGSHFDVRGGVAAVTFELEFSGDGVEAVKASEDRISEILAERTKGEVKVERDPEKTTFLVATDIATLVDQQGITAIRGANVSKDPDGQTRVQVDLGAPAELMKAITAGAGSQSDAAALSVAALGATRVGVTVSMGAISSAEFLDSSGVRSQAPHSATVAEWYFDLGQLRTGSLTVVGVDGQDSGGVNKIALAAAVGIGAFTVVALRRSRRRGSPG